jgi:hypothetical protein
MKRPFIFPRFTQWSVYRELMIVNQLPVYIQQLQGKADRDATSFKE